MDLEAMLQEIPVIGNQSHLTPNRMVKKTKLIFQFVIGLMSIATPQTLSSVKRYYHLAHEARNLIGIEYDRASFYTHQGKIKKLHNYRCLECIIVKFIDR